MSIQSRSRRSRLFTLLGISSTAFVAAQILAPMQVHAADSPVPPHQVTADAAAGWANQSVQVDTDKLPRTADGAQGWISSLG